MKSGYLKKYKHAPAHLFLDTYPYFITSGTYLKKYYFENDQKKKILFEIITEILQKNAVELLAWVILSNHYHLLINLKEPVHLPEIIRKIHSKSSVIINREEKITDGRIWHNYWDRCIRDEKDYYSKLNYIHYNPVKHNYAKDPSQYDFSSYKVYLEELGSKRLTKLVTDYPVEELGFKDDY
jgi:putative transposase